jgi:hypothetical protein
MKFTLITAIFLFVFYHSQGQAPVGSWTDHLVYNTAKDVVATGNEIYASTGSSILVFNKEFDELRKLSGVNGLTETGISTIGWSEENKTLVVAYSSTNVDLVKEKVIYNIPDIARKYIPGRKEINRVRIIGRYAYLACSFGIVVIDLIKREVYDTWKPGVSSDVTEVWDIATVNNRLYAATSSGMFSAELSNPGLAWFGSWSRIANLPGPEGRFTAVVSSGSRIYVNKSPLKSACDTIYSIDATTSVFSYIPGVVNRSFNYTSTGFSVASGSSIRFFSQSGTLQKTISTYGWGVPDAAQAVEQNGVFYIADLKAGLIKSSANSTFTVMSVPGPLSNNATSITSLNGKTIICGGAVTVTWNNMLRPFEVSIFENNKWTLISDPPVIDALRAAIDPVNNNHFFISSWGGGLLEFENNTLKNRFYEANSPLQTIIPGAPYVRICGMAFDNQRNLWITQTEVPGSIKVYKPDGTWIVNPVTIDAPTIGDIIITRRNHKWIVLPRGFGLFVLDDNNTPADFADDRSRKMLVTDSESKIISMVNCVAEDLEGNIWVGTDQGPLVYYNPEKVFEEDIRAFRVKIPRNDGSGLADYMLGTELITAIAIDGANRKWIGTASSGAYLLSPDGTKRLRNYNETNSPVFSNSIVSIGIDNKNSEVWFGTSKGIISVRGDATAGNEKFEDVYAFPNPVREDYSGNITITGLMRDTHIRITDISGNLVFRTISDGGMATWDLTTYNGRRVSTGVYLAFCASSDGSQSHVIKILVIR